MEQVPGSSSGKTAIIQQISAVLSAEAKLHMFVFALLVPCLEIYLLWDKENTTGSAFVFITIGLFFFYCVLQHVFELFVSGKAPAIFSLLPNNRISLATPYFMIITLILCDNIADIHYRSVLPKALQVIELS